MYVPRPGGTIERDAGGSGGVSALRVLRQRLQLWITCQRARFNAKVLFLHVHIHREVNPVEAASVCPVCRKYWLGIEDEVA